MLNVLMIDLANIEQEQKRWSSGSLSGARGDGEPEKQHIENILDDPKVDWEAENAESSDEEAESDQEGQLQSTIITTREIDVNMEEYDEADADICAHKDCLETLPPQLTADSKSNLDENRMPLSPSNLPVDALKQRQAITTT